MIESIELKNFKGFQQSGIIDMKKINILVGPNSSGKSSFIKSLLALKNSIDSKDEESVLGLTQEIGAYKTIVHKNDIDNKIVYSIDLENRISLTVEDFRKLALRLIMFKISNKYTQEVNDNFKINEVLKYLKEKREEFIVDNIKITFALTPLERVMVDEFMINFTNGDSSIIYRQENTYRIKYKNKNISVSDIIKPYKFYFKIDEEKLHNLQEDEIENMAILDFILNDIEKRLSQFTDKLIYLEPLRSKFNRVEYVTNLNLLNTVGSKGENTLTTLLGISKMDKTDIKERIHYWLNDFDLGEHIEAMELGSDNYSICIKNKYTGVYNNILDVGVGTSQLLPIIIESVNSPEGSTLIIEEPETHIHPNAQSKLADLFADCAKEQEKKFIIETHSIFLITQLQILVAQGKINPEDIKIYYFLQDKKGSRVMDMKLTDKGQFQEEWPSGFFDVHYELGKKLFKYL